MRHSRAAVLLLACACAHGRNPSAADSGFLELESAHYVLLTELPEPDARQTLARIENVRGALTAGSWRGESLPAERLRILQFASSGRLHEFASPGMSALYQPVDLFGEPMLVMTADHEGAGDAILQHELAHAVHGSFLPRNPRWFFEGLACYLETLRSDAAGNRYLLGEPNLDRLHFLRLHRETIDYRRVLSTTTREAVLMSGQDGYAFQSASWLLVFFLANERPAELDDYVRRRGRGEPGQTAFAAAFAGLDADALAQQAEPYRQMLQESVDGARPPSYRVREVRPPPWTGEVKLSRPPAAEMEALRAELYFLSPGTPRDRAKLPEARTALDRALRLDPLNPLALAVQAALSESASGQPSLDRLRESARERPRDFRAQLLLAIAVGPGRPDERREALVRAAALAPSNATVLNALAWHDLTHGRATEAVEVARKAAGLAPGRAAVLDTLAAALALSGNCAEATRAEEQAVELAAEHASLELRRMLLARLDAMRAGCARVLLEGE